MDFNTPISIEDSTVAEPHSCPGDVSVDATAQYRSDLVTFGWWLIAVGSILAAGIYPLLLIPIGTIIYFAENLAALTSNPANSSAILTEVIKFCLFMPLFSLGCLFWLSAIAALILPVLHLVVRSLELRVSFTRLGAFTGGLLVFFATFPMWLDWPRNAGSWEVARVLLLGPAVATIVGQIGGAYGGLRASRRAEHQSKVRQRLMKLGWREPAVYDIPRDANEPSTNKYRPWFRFRTSHLLWVAAWISLLLAAIRSVGVRFETVLPVIFGWLLYQTVTLWLGAVLVRRIAPWWASRWQGRST